MAEVALRDHCCAASLVSISIPPQALQWVNTAGVSVWIRHRAQVNAANCRQQNVLGMASDVHSAVPYGGGGKSSTANLVRLLRETEEGKGLEIDYSDALGEALGEDSTVGDNIPRATARQQKGAKRSLTLLGKVPSLGRKRWVMTHNLFRPARHKPVRHFSIPTILL